jgi:hypothetical protein
MKRHLISLSAVVSAILLVAFTTPKNSKQTLVYFEFVGTVTIEAEVKNPVKWKEVPNLGVCSGTNIKACRVAADGTSVEGLYPDRKLKITCNIYTGYHAPTMTYYVLIGGCVVDKKNKN